MNLSLSDHHSAFTPYCLDRLQKSGISSVQQFLRAKNDRLEKVTGLPLRLLDEMRTSILKRLGVSMIIWPVSYHHLIIKTFQASSVDLSSISGKQYATGIPLLDDLMDGGLSSGSINEFIGFTSCGKTYLTQSICLQLIKGHDHLNALIISNSSQEGVSGSLRSILERQSLDNDVITYHIILLSN